MDNDFGKKYVFYSSTHAINFQAVKSRSGFATANVEITQIESGKPRWDNKTSLQLSEIDLYKCFYLISNEKPVRIKSDYHGASRNKSLMFEEGDSGDCKVTLLEKGQARYFSCSPGQWFYAKLLFCEQLLGHGLSMTEARGLFPTT